MTMSARLRWGWMVLGAVVVVAFAVGVLRDSGPRSAQALGLDPRVAITDAILMTLPERRQRVHTRMRRGAPSIIARTRCRFGSCVLLVLMFECEILLTTILFLLQTSHVNAIFVLHCRGIEGQ